MRWERRFDQLAAVLVEKLEGHVHLVAHLGQTLQAHQGRGCSHHAVDAEVLGEIDLHAVWKFGDLAQQTVLMTAGRLDGAAPHQVVHPGEVRGGLELRHGVPEDHDAAAGDEVDLVHLHAILAADEFAGKGEGGDRRADLKTQRIGRAVVHAEERGGLFLLRADGEGSGGRSRP